VSLVEIALAWLIWFGLIRAGEVSRVAVYVFFVPLISIVIGAIFLDERLTLSLLIGTFLIVTGIYTVNRSSTGKDKTRQLDLQREADVDAFARTRACYVDRGY
jgi:drug/metabolite transporter (DMT)-like permease